MQDATRRPARLEDLGRMDYRAAWARQLEVVEERQRGEGVDALLLVEHPHVITVGRSRGATANVLAAGDVPVVEVERGGDVTYHGPGQLVAYPVLRLEEDEQDLHRYLRALEAGLIDALAALGLPGAERREGATGVWVAGRKIASIGVAVRRWVTYHGVALNVSTDLAQFARINPCGFNAQVMTSLTRELGREVTIETAAPVVVRALGLALGRGFV